MTTNNKLFSYIYRGEQEFLILVLPSKISVRVYREESYPSEVIIGYDSSANILEDLGYNLIDE